MPDTSVSSDGDERARGNMFSVVDDLIAHMQMSRRMFMVLIVAAFAAAPAAIVLGIMLLSPPPFVKTDLVKFEAVPPDLSAGANPQQGIGVITVAPAGESGGKLFVQGPIGVLGPAKVYGNLSAPDKLSISQSSRFIFVGGKAGVTPAYPVDLTKMVFAFVAISVILASIMMFIGLKEYRFFSRWNTRYREFASLQEMISRKLDEEK